jgi:hypothetical protein
MHDRRAGSLGIRASGINAYRLRRPFLWWDGMARTYLRRIDRGSQDRAYGYRSLSSRALSTRWPDQRRASRAFREATTITP